MTKRIGMLALVAFLLCTATTALAGTPYVNRQNGYAVTIPDGWIKMDSGATGEVEDTIRAEGIDGMDPSFVEQHLPQIGQLDVAMFTTVDGMTNFNIAYQPMSWQYSAQELVDTLAPIAIQEYKTLFNDLTVVDAGSVQTIGNFAFCKVEISAVSLGSEVGFAQYCYCGASSIYVFTFTRTDSRVNRAPDLAALAQEVLTTFKPGN